MLINYSVKQYRSKKITHFYWLLFVQKKEEKGITQYALDKLDGVFCYLWPCFAFIGLISPALYLNPPLFLLLLFVQHTIVDAHSKEKEHTGNNEDNTASLVSVLVVIVDVFESPCGKRTTFVIFISFSMLRFRVKFLWSFLVISHDVWKQLVSVGII